MTYQQNAILGSIYILAAVAIPTGYYMPDWMLPLFLVNVTLISYICDTCAD